MIIKEMNEKDAKEICGWEYDSEYVIYNIGGWNNALKDKWAITDETKRKEQFRSMYQSNKLIGYFRLINKEDKIKIGLGLHPSLCGLGLGNIFLLNILDYDELKNKIIELEVRKFNKRAINCYKKVGFEIVNQNDDFFIMILNNLKK